MEAVKFKEEIVEICGVNGCIYLFDENNIDSYREVIINVNEIDNRHKEVVKEFVVFSVSPTGIEGVEYNNGNYFIPKNYDDLEYSNETECIEVEDICKSSLPLILKAINNIKLEVVK